MGTATLDRPKAEPSFYEADETGWLEHMARCIAEGRIEELDLPHLQEYLTDMDTSDRREVFSRLRLLLSHWLKWEFQPEHRSKSWQGTIREQRNELELILNAATLRNHAHQILDAVYDKAAADAAEETGLPRTAFPAANPHTLEDWLALSFG